MGNSNTKESRPGYPDGTEGVRDPRAGPSDPRSRTRMSRAELGFLGLGNGTSSRDRDRPDAPFERRETRQEREARKLERERAIRLKERERSLREEHVDGGYLVTLGTYTGTEDFSKPVVRQLQIDRKLAPFWRGLNDWSDNWAEHQIVAAARGLPIPAADDPPDPDLIPRPPPIESSSSQNLQNLTVPMGPRTLSAASDRSGSGAGSGLSSPTTPGPAKGSIKPRGRALAAALSLGSRNASSTDLMPKETMLTHDPFVNGQPLEVFLYKDATECPICFLTYPPYLNKTRCCDQAICSECFVQIKRSDPHLPEHHPDGQARDPNEGLSADDPPEMLISEPSACPYCQQPECGITYDPPPFRRGLAYTSSPSNIASSPAMSSQSSLNSTLPSPPPQAGRRRTHSLSATAPGVITTDRIRPDWATKLAAARAHQARRAAAATALHAAAFIVGGNEQRSILRPGRFSRRNTSNNNNNNTAGSSEPQSGNATDVPDAEASPDGPRRPGDGSRRSRMDELEEMMFMEAVRLSLATEEDRKRKEEKLLRKDAKKREKEERKAQKKQAKDPYGGGASGASGSSLSLGLGRRRGNSAASNLRMEATVQGAASRSEDSPPLEPETSNDKGKGVDRGQHDGAEEGGYSVPSLPIPTSSSRGGSHLRQMSNASSIGSSVNDSPSGSYSQGYLGTDPNNPRSSELSVAGRSDDGDRDTGSEPLFNFRSLAEIVGVNIDDGSARREGDSGGESPSSRELSGSPLPQVRENVKEEEEAEAEHVEGGDHRETSAPAKDAEPTKATAAGGSPEDADHLGISPPPELTITPDTPAADDDAGEHKQLGQPSVAEQPYRVVQ